MTTRYTAPTSSHHIDQLAIERLADCLQDHDYRREWELLSFGNIVPEGMMIRKAVGIAKEVWSTAILRAVHGRPEVIYYVFCQTLLGNPITVTSSRIPITFDDFRAVAIDEGVDIQIQSWIDGVPIEFVLGE